MTRTIKIHQSSLNKKGAAILRQGILLFAFLILVDVNSFAQQYTSGDVVADFRLPEVGTDSVYHLNEMTDASAVVLVFFGNECPYAKLYQKRLKDFHQRFSSSGVIFLAINSYNQQEYPDESVRSMQASWDTLAMPMPYLADKRGSVARDYDVKRVPQAFVLTPDDEGHFILRYRGVIDDNPQLAEDTHNDYLKDAIHAVLHKKTPPKTYVRPIGCNLR